jgi:hypothetical protein
MFAPGTYQLTMDFTPHDCITELIQMVMWITQGYDKTSYFYILATSIINYDYGKAKRLTSCAAECGWHASVNTEAMTVDQEGHDCS